MKTTSPPPPSTTFLRRSSIATVLLLGLAGPLVGQNQPVVSPSSMDAGAGRSAVANVTIDATIGGFGGRQTNPSGSVQSLAGFSGQIIKTRPFLGLPSPSFPNDVNLPLFGEDDLHYRVQTSTTLRTNSWVTLWSGRTINGVAPILHPGVAFAPHRFYRANQIP